LQVGRLVPEERGFLAQGVFHGVEGVVVAIAAGKNHHSKFHRRRDSSGVFN
jgi:hypothetical protein